MSQLKSIYEDDRGHDMKPQQAQSYPLSFNEDKEDLDL